MDQPLPDVTDDDIVQAMIGRELNDLFPEVSPAGEETALEVKGLHVSGYPAPVDLSVRRGEILGLAGLVGAGRTELLEAIFGVRKSTAGTVSVAGTDVAPQLAGGVDHPRDGPGPGGPQGGRGGPHHERPRQRLAAAAVAASRSAAGCGRGRGRRAVKEAMSSVRLRSRGMNQHVGTLSGGNQQKVVLARWLTGHVDVLLLDEPTRGVDVGARSEIYRIITELAAGRHGGGHGVIGHARDPQPLPPGVRHARTARSSAELDRAALVRARRPGDGLPPRGRTGPRRPGSGNRPDGADSPSADGPPAPRLAPPCHRPPRRTCDEHATGSARAAVRWSRSPTREPAARSRGAWFRDQLIRHAMVIVMLLVIAYFSYRSARFGTLDNIQTILVAAAPFALIALGQTLVILTGGIDLSVGSVIAVSAMAAAATVKGHPDRLWLSVLVADVRRPRCRCGQRLPRVAKVNVPPFIATLGMLTAASGLAYVIGGGAPINGLPGDFGKIANTKIFGLQIPVLVMIVGIIGPGVDHGADHLRHAHLRRRRQPRRGRDRRRQDRADPVQRLCHQRRPRRAVRRHAGLAGHLRAAQPRSGLRARRHRRGGHRRRQPDGRPGQHLGNGPRPAADPDPQQRPRHPRRARPTGRTSSRASSSSPPSRSTSGPPGDASSDRRRPHPRHQREPHSTKRSIIMSHRHPARPDRGPRRRSAARHCRLRRR